MTEMTFNGTTATSLGVVVLDYPPIVKPRARISTIVVPGRSGVLTLHDPETVYEAYEKTVRCRMLSTATQTAVADWLDGDGTLIFGNESTYAYTARVIEQVDFNKIVPGYDDRVFEVTFLVQPWKELAVPDADITLSTNPQTIVSVATLDSLPLIQIAGTGAVSINIGSYSFTLSGIEAGVPVLVDCDAMTVTNVNQSVSYIQNMVGQFPRLVPGNNVVTHSGTVTSIVIRPRYRWL
jgi:phage-related protein